MTAMPRLMLASLLLAACSPGASAPPPAQPPPLPPPPLVTVIAPRTSVQEPPLVDLIHHVDAVVAVSSKVDNPRDFPEHLVDGNPLTAWNGRTGDLHGFIAFRVPPVTRVRRVELTVGFDKVGKDGDLFTMNHRITRVRLSRLLPSGDKTPILESALDPEVRGFQGLVVDEPGGDFVVDVLETLPGTKKAWRELTVSEFRVLGLALGAPENPHHLPAMAIGGLDGVKPAPPSPSGAPPVAPFPTVAALCAAYDRVMTPIIDAAFPGDRYPGTIAGPHCELLRGEAGPSMPPVGPFLAGRFVRVNDAQEQKAELVLQTSAGWTLTPVVLWSRFLDDPGCGHGSREAFEVPTVAMSSLGRPYLLVRIARTDIYWLGSPDPGGTIETAYACSLDARGVPSCEGPAEAGRSVGWPPGWDPGQSAYPDVVLDKLPWSFRKEPTVGPAGDLRLR